MPEPERFAPYSSGGISEKFDKFTRYFNKFFALRGGATPPPPETIVRIHVSGRSGATANAGIRGEIRTAFQGELRDKFASIQDGERDFATKTWE